MGNCQAAEAATVVIQHPSPTNKIERIYWSVSANQVMTSNPGHYVALVITSPTVKSDTGAPVKQLKLLRPDDTLLIGQVYRLVSFEDVLKEFAAKKCVKLGKLLKERGGLGLPLPAPMETMMMMKKECSVSGCGAPNPNPKSQQHWRSTTSKAEHEVCRMGSNNGSSSRGVARHHHGGGGGGQWKPALQSIAEVGT